MMRTRWAQVESDRKQSFTQSIINLSDKVAERRGCGTPRLDTRERIPEHIDEQIVDLSIEAGEGLLVELKILIRRRRSTLQRSHSPLHASLPS